MILPWVPDEYKDLWFKYADYIRRTPNPMKWNEYADKCAILEKVLIDAGVFSGACALDAKVVTK